MLSVTTEVINYLGQIFFFFSNAKRTMRHLGLYYTGALWHCNRKRTRAAQEPIISQRDLRMRIKVWICAPLICRRPWNGRIGSSPKRCCAFINLPLTTKCQQRFRREVGRQGEGEERKGFISLSSLPPSLPPWNKNKTSIPLIQFHQLHHFICVRPPHDVQNRQIIGRTNSTSNNFV